jgi:hypothetical protein
MYGMTFLIMSGNIDAVQKLIIIAMVALVCMIAYLIILNINTLRRVIKRLSIKQNKIDDERYHELNNNIQLLIVVSSIILLLGGFLGYNSIDSIKGDIQDKMNDYVSKLSEYSSQLLKNDSIIYKYSKLIPILENERDTTFKSLLNTKNELENAKTSLIQLQNDYRLSAKTYLVKGIKIDQKSINPDTKYHRIYFKDLKKINNRIPVIFNQEPYITVIGIGGYSGIDIMKISTEYFEYQYGGTIEIDEWLLSILTQPDKDLVNKDEIPVNNYLKSMFTKNIENKSKTNTSSDATIFDLIIVEGTNY